MVLQKRYAQLDLASKLRMQHTVAARLAMLNQKRQERLKAAQAPATYQLLEEQAALERYVARVFDAEGVSGIRAAKRQFLEEACLLQLIPDDALCHQKARWILNGIADGLTLALENKRQLPHASAQPVFREVLFQLIRAPLELDYYPEFRFYVNQISAEIKAAHSIYTEQRLNADRVLPIEQAMQERLAAHPEDLFKFLLLPTPVLTRLGSLPPINYRFIPDNGGADFARSLYSAMRRGVFSFNQLDASLAEQPYMREWILRLYANLEMVQDSLEGYRSLSLPDITQGPLFDWLKKAAWQALEQGQDLEMAFGFNSKASELNEEKFKAALRCVRASLIKDALQLEQLALKTDDVVQVKTPLKAPRI